MNKQTSDDADAQGVREAKAAERARLLAMRRGLPAVEKERLSNRIQELVLADRRWREARAVVLYMAIRGEVSTERLLDAAWMAGKTVFLPRCLPRDPLEPPSAGGRMELVVCPDRDSLFPGAFGVPEPGPHCTDKVPEDGSGLPDLAIVPVVGLRPDGARLGYGGGYYDRAFSRPAWIDIPRLALAYGFQLASFPVNRDTCGNDASGPGTLLPDVVMHGYATEEGLLWL